jgi:hypothetical protein
MREILRRASEIERKRKREEGGWCTEVTIESLLQATRSD